ncbi:MAG: 18S rRNA maturation protein [Alyxoria varia]|nr:MAG: 18S rRNA maturation protein [Alyxoria varia]
MPLPRPPPPIKSAAKQQKRQADNHDNPGFSSHKRRLRNLTRALENRGSELPGHVRSKLEADLLELREEDARREVRRRRDKVVGKYHMVRFFDRKKATRHIKRAEKLLASSKSEEDRAAAEKALRVARVDLNYSLYHPLEKRYCALYQKGPKPEEPDPKENGQTPSKQTQSIDDRNELSAHAREIWEKIEGLTDRCEEDPEDGKRLLEDLRNEQVVRVKVKGEPGRKFTSAEVMRDRQSQGEDLSMLEDGRNEIYGEGNGTGEAIEAGTQALPSTAKNRRERRKELREKGEQNDEPGDGLGFFE